MNKKAVTASNFYTNKYSDSEWLIQKRKDAQILVNAIDKLAIFNSQSRVLDVGCGAGGLANEIAKRYQSETYGIDINKTGIDKAKKLGIKAVVGDLDEPLPYQKSFFDVVTATEIIEHLINPDHFLKEIRRVLKSGGCLVITTPNLAVWFNRLIFLFGYQPFFLEPSTVDKTVGLSFTRGLTPHRKPVGHIRCFTLKALKDILELHQYKVIFTKGNKVYYLPKFMKPIDNFFSFFPALATNFTVVAKK